MMESPFETIQKVMAESSNAFDDLRIIAGGPARLDTQARDIIRAAADELENTWRQLVSTQAALIEVQQRLIAVNDRLIEMRADAVRAQETKKPAWSMSSGWMKLETPT